MLQASPQVMRDKKPILHLFIHETQRVFHDRLINKEDKLFFHNIMSETVAKYLGEVSKLRLMFSFDRKLEILMLSFCGF